MGSKGRSCQRQKIHRWKPYSEAERIALYRRVWGPAWSPGGMGNCSAGRSRRDELIEQHTIVVETTAGALLRAGQSPAIQKDDLLQVGYAELIRTVGRPGIGTLALDKRIARNCKTAMIRFIEDERREWRYVQQGREKAIRDTRAAVGRPAGDASFREGAGEFLYPDWLRGSVSVCRRARADLLDELEGCDLPEELAEIIHRVGYEFKEIPEWARRFYMRSKLDCLK